MARTVHVECDICGKQMNETSHHADYGIEVSSFVIHHGGSEIVTGLMTYPHIEKDLHFCGWSCFKRWMRKKLEN